MSVDQEYLSNPFLDRYRLTSSDNESNECLQEIRAATSHQQFFAVTDALKQSQTQTSIKCVAVDKKLENYFSASCDTSLRISILNPDVLQSNQNLFTPTKKADLNFCQLLEK